MSYQWKPCDPECSFVNRCSGYRHCERCGRGFCAYGEEEYCEDCAAEVEAEKETEEE